MSGASDDLVGAVVAVGGFVIHLLTVLRAITRPNRTPASRVAWVAVIMCLPVIGVVAYLFLGETSIGRERARRLRDAESRLATPSGAGAEPGDPVATTVSDLCRSINGFGPTPGNRIVLLGDPRRLPGRADTRLRRRDQGADRGVRCRDRAHPPQLLHLARRRKRRPGRRRDQRGGAPGRGLPGHGRRARVARLHPRPPLAPAARGRRPPARRAGGHPPPGPLRGRPGRPAQPPQAGRHRQPDRVLRQPELRRPAVPGQGEVRALDRHPAALRRAGRAAGTAPLPRHLDRRDRRGPLRAARGGAGARAAPRRRGRADVRHRTDHARQPRCRTPSSARCTPPSTS